MYSWKFEGSDRPRGCHPGLSVTSPREEGGIWTTRLHLVRQARRCEGGFLVGRTSRISAGCAVTAQKTNWISA